MPRVKPIGGLRQPEFDPDIESTTAVEARNDNLRSQIAVLRLRLQEKKAAITENKVKIEQEEVEHQELRATVDRKRKAQDCAGKFEELKRELLSVEADRRALGLEYKKSIPGFVESEADKEKLIDDNRNLKIRIPRLARQKDDNAAKIANLKKNLDTVINTTSLDNSIKLREAALEKTKALIALGNETVKTAKQILMCPACIDIPSGDIHVCRLFHMICKDCHVGAGQHNHHQLQNCTECKSSFYNPEARALYARSRAALRPNNPS